MARMFSGSVAALATLLTLAPFAMSSDAGAVVLPSFTVTGNTESNIGRTFYDFDTVRNTNIGSFSGTWSSRDGSSSPTYTDPNFFGINPTSIDPNNWFSVGTNNTDPDTASLIFDKPVSYVGFRWGTTDPYNKLDVVGTSGGIVATIFGAPTTVDPRTGKNVSDASPTGLPGNHFFNLYAGSERIKELRFTSIFAFEADNFAVVVPLPAGIVLLLTAIGGLAMGSHLRRRTQVAPAAV
jgi:hypothetical protein